MAILAVVRPIFQPAMRIITSISNSYPVTITTTFDHQYQTGMIVRINIPLGFGMQQANQLYSDIMVTGLTTFTMDIDTSSFDPYIIPVVFPFSYQSGQVTSIAEISSLISNAMRNTLPHSS